MMTGVLLRCVVGDDISNLQVDYWQGGRLTKQDLSFALRNSFQQCVNRMSTLHVCLLPFLANVYLTPHERDLRANCLSIRNLVASIIEERKHEVEKGSTKDDLLSIMLQDSLFMDDEQITVDELLTVFFAGSQTSSNVTQNLILHLCKHPQYKQQILTEIQLKSAD